MKTRINKLILREFEEGLNTIHIEKSVIPARILGYGEISSVFEIDGMPGLAFKRMPLFDNRAEAEKYVLNYQEYCVSLKAAGIELPESETVILEQGKLVILYIVQPILQLHHFGHKLLHSMPDDKIEFLLRQIAVSINKVWVFNREHQPGLEIAIDGQISNWVWAEEGGEHKLYFIDTSTPLLRKNGVEQFDPELFLKSAPSFLRWLIRWLFLDEVMTHYYDPEKVFVDLAANLHKEQRPELIPEALNILNEFITDRSIKITKEMVDKYYREDKITWWLFLLLRRIDRWIKVSFLGKGYVYILPGKIKR